MSLRALAAGAVVVGALTAGLCWSLAILVDGTTALLNIIATALEGNT